MSKKEISDKKHNDKVLQKSGSKELVYFIVHPESSRKAYLKVGKSSSEQGVVDRVKGCQTGNPIDLICLGYMEGMESDWHDNFHHAHERGEWFDYFRVNEIVKQLRLKVPRKILEEFKSIRKNEQITKIKKIEEEIRRDKIFNFVDSDEDDDEGLTSKEEWNKYKEERFSSELQEIQRRQDKMIEIDNLKGDKLIEAYRKWAYNIIDDPRDLDYYYRSERKEAIENMHKIERVISFLHKGLHKDDWYGSTEIRIAESKSHFLDKMNRAVRPGDYYIMIGEYQSGYSLESGLAIYKLFLNFLKQRKDKKNGSIFGKGGKRHLKQVADYSEYLKRDDIEHDPENIPEVVNKLESLSLKKVIDCIKDTIDEELGIKFYDPNLSMHRNKDAEKYLDRYNKMKEWKKRLQNESQN